jgi:NAD dependent epimerase/dehydratase family enzyme
MIVIAGGTGLLGRPLAARLAAVGHPVTVHAQSIPATTGHDSSRTATGQSFRLSGAPNGTTGAWSRTIDGANAVVNLAGESIAPPRAAGAMRV